jgi:hypothetical protein
MISTPGAIQVPPAANVLPAHTRRRVRRLWRTLLLLERDVGDQFRTAVYLSFHPQLADCVESTPHDHLVADFLVALRATRAAIVDLEHPIDLAQDAGPIAHDDQPT